jgi:hypothetical protein
MAAVWTECINLTVLQKKSGAPAESGALLFYGHFGGCFGKSGCLRVVFCGDFVVNCVVKRGGWMVVFWGAKNMPLNLNFSVEIAKYFGSMYFTQTSG